VFPHWLFLRAAGKWLASRERWKAHKLSPGHDRILPDEAFLTYNMHDLLHGFSGIKQFAYPAFSMSEIYA
ncbi:hypothetical protein BOV92_08020, partial [Solemya velum gill symbiont]